MGSILNIEPILCFLKLFATFEKNNKKTHYKVANNEVPATL